MDFHFQDESFSRKIGYAQQQDIHLSTPTVRGALHFSALLRQSDQYSRADKLVYTGHVINLLDMGHFADAVIGQSAKVIRWHTVQGSDDNYQYKAGLNTEQRERVTIGVELVARPELLLFLDELTSGLDSDTARSIIDLLRKLARNGQAIHCTIHRSSGVLLQMFDKLLFPSQGRSRYYGDLGDRAQASLLMRTHCNGFATLEAANRDP